MRVRPYRADDAAALAEIFYRAVSVTGAQVYSPEEIAAWVGFLISPAGDVSSGNVIILNQGRDVR